MVGRDKTGEMPSNKPMVPTVPTHPMSTHRTPCCGTSASCWAAAHSAMAGWSMRFAWGSINRRQTPSDGYSARRNKGES